MSPWLGTSVLSCLMFTVFGEVTKPRNVRLHSVNLRNVLQWDPPISQGENVTYMAQYIGNVCDRGTSSGLHANDSRGKESPTAVCQDLMKMSADSEGESVSKFHHICQNTVLTECMFSGLTYGCFCISVRSEFEKNTSDWESIFFIPVEQTTIGPPTEVNVKPRAGFLDVSFVCPMYEHEQIPLNNLYGGWVYTVRYWKKSNTSQVKLVNTTQNFEILSDLEPWTTYCLQVQASAPEHSKIGELSPVVCEKTTDDGKTSWWVKAAAFLVSMAVVAGLATGVFFLSSHIYRVTRYIFFPVCSFPQHLKEYLNKPVYSTPFPASQSKEGEEELCHTLTVISEEESRSGSENIRCG